MPMRGVTHLPRSCGGPAPGCTCRPVHWMPGSPRGQRQQRTEAEGRAAYQRMQDYSTALKARGVLRTSQSLATDTSGMRVKVRDGKPMLIDGPFAESKEM